VGKLIKEVRDIERIERDDYSPLLQLIIV